MQYRTSWNRVKSFSVGQEIPHMLWNAKVHYRAHNSSKLVPVLRQMYAICYINPYYFLELTLNIVLPSEPKFSKQFASLSFLIKLLLAFLFSLVLYS
jgi:hypothetical protein